MVPVFRSPAEVTPWQAEPRFACDGQSIEPHTVQSAKTPCEDCGVGFASQPVQAAPALTPGPENVVLPSTTDPFSHDSCGGPAQIRAELRSVNPSRVQLQVSGWTA